MTYALLIILVLPTLSKAQPNVTGLGKYVIGSTTPDSLNRAEFTEEEESYVKGTIALPCSHIRTFTADTLTITGIPVTNLVLVFYDETLFKISCDYSNSLGATFLKQYRPGVRKTVKSFLLCTKESDKPLLLWGETWPGVDTTTLVVYRKGYTADCKLEEGVRLIIANQRIAALSSDCDLKPADPVIDAFIKSP